MSDEGWKELNERVASVIRLYLVKNVLANIGKIPSAKEFWERLENLYHAKSISNCLFLKEQFHLLRMIEGTKFFYHLSVLNDIMTELEAIEIQIEDDDKMLKLLWSLLTLYKNLLPILFLE